MVFGKGHKTGAYEAGHTLITKIQNGNLCLDHTAFDRFLTESNIGNKAFSIISISGAARQGKSFMMNIILRFFETKAWVSQNTMNTREEKLRMTAFKVDSGYKAVTTGILLYNHTFEVEWNGQPMVIILMDTQGIFDRSTSKKDEAFILTIATLMSTVQIFNVNRTVDTTRFEALDNAIKYGQLTARDNQYLQLQDLIFLVRDKRMTREGCKEYLDDLLEENDGCSDEYIATRVAIKATFSYVDLFCLPKPGDAVEDLTMDKSEIDDKDIEERFLLCVDTFLKSTIRPGKLKPKFTNDGKPIKIRNLYKLMILCENQFKKSNDGHIEPQMIMEGEDRVAYEDKFEQLYNEFVDGIQDVDGESEEEVNTFCRRLSETILQKFDKEVSQWKACEGGKQYEMKYRYRLTEQIQNAISGRVLKWINQQASKKLNMKMETERLFEEYVTSMESYDSVKKLEREHDLFRKKVSDHQNQPYDKDLLFCLTDAKLMELIECIENKEEDGNAAKKFKEARSQYGSGKSCEENEARIKVLRGQMIHSYVKMRKKSLSRLWIKLMNEKANAKTKSFFQYPSTTRDEDLWREMKSLTLTKNDMTDIYNDVRNKVLGDYWNINLEEIEKWSVKKLSKKLLGEWTNITQIDRLQYFMPLQLPADSTLQFSKEGLAKAGRMMGKAVGLAKDGINEGEKEKQSRLIEGIAREFGEDLRKKVAQYKKKEKKTPDMTKIYADEATAAIKSHLDRMCPDLMKGYNQLESLVIESDSEITKMRERVKEDFENKLAIFMRLVISGVEEEFKRVMAATHYDPDKLKEKYLQHLDEGYEEMHNDVSHGHAIIDEIKSSVYEKAKVTESLTRILEQNEKSKGQVIDEASENIPVPESRNIFQRFYNYVKSLFQKKQ